MTLRHCLLILCLAISLLARPASADNLYLTTLQDSQDYALRWTQAWVAIYGTAATASLALAANSGSSAERYSARVRAVSASLGLLDTLLYPPPHRKARMDGLEEDAIKALAEEIATLERHRQGWQRRIGPLIVNTAAGLAIGVEDNRPRDGFAAALTGMITSELRIRTEPQHFSRMPSHHLRVGEAALPVYPHWALLPDQLVLGVRF
ncbi:MAG: hypothetical protein LAT63_10185 [Marinobacter sp.]|nr:hypothetical protein [Marinobacter sp.]